MGECVRVSKHEEQTPNEEEWKMISGIRHFAALRNNAQYVAALRAHERSVTLQIFWR